MRKNNNEVGGEPGMALRKLAPRLFWDS